jgi:two-component system, cell cycle sensor histidine kinase and response regulator CckA
MLARTILEADGFIVEECEDGAKAVEWVRLNPNRATLILMDMTMPNMSGRDAYELIMAIDPSSRIIFSSGYSIDDLNTTDQSFGILNKPYRPNDLLKAVHAVLNHQPESLTTK